MDMPTGSTIIQGAGYGGRGSCMFGTTQEPAQQFIPALSGHGGAVGIVFL